LYAKQGRLTQFRTKAERDAFLRREIDSIKSYRETLTHDLEEMRHSIDQERVRLSHLEDRENAVRADMNERKERMGVLGEDIAKWKEEHSEKVERRK
jgi:structural maintenance of chromosome 3 (chondroitin sulfate proteoglycan 6)